jgi:hypothetical protein
MYYNPDTDRALRNLEDTRVAGRKAMAQAPHVSQADIVWDVVQKRWVPNPNK